MPVDASAPMGWLGVLWFGLAAAAESPKPPAPTPVPDAELIEFLGSFETRTGQWPELNEILAARTPPPAPPKPKEDVKR